MITYGDTYSVYIHINKINNKVYVGSTRKTPVEKRWLRNGLGYKKQKRFYDDILKFGWDNFEHEIFASGLNFEEANNMEKLLIAKLDATNPDCGYNYERGGACPNEDERCKKIAESELGEKHHMYGKHHSKETREKIRASLLGENGCWYGKKLPEDIRKQLSEYAIQNNVADRLTKSNIARRKPVKCVETQVTYASAGEAEEKTSVNRISICRAVRGLQQTAGGLHWELL